MADRPPFRPATDHTILDQVTSARGKHQQAMLKLFQRIRALTADGLEDLAHARPADEAVHGIGAAWQNLLGELKALNAYGRVEVVLRQDEEGRRVA